MNSVESFTFKNLEFKRDKEAFFFFPNGYGIRVTKNPNSNYLYWVVQLHGTPVLHEACSDLCPYSDEEAVTKTMLYIQKIKP